MEIKKVEVDLYTAYRLLHPRHVVLVSCVDTDGKANVITLAWSMPTSHRPPLIAISVAPRRYSHQLIQETKEFVVNIPTVDIVKETLLCGRITGRRYNKFREARLTPLPAKMVEPPIIKECVAHLECKLCQQITTGDHTLFIGSVLTAYANEGFFKEGKVDLRKVKPVYHVGEDDFVTPSSKIITPRL
ncbi:MAG: Flavin reductase like domain protein [Candidatus Bathyarchaeota archaeon BA1]|nr:MAG: Flavin reductase like domain protein [Candidatus Bathyarchaeota archaeon BA1]